MKLQSFDEFKKNRSLTSDYKPPKYVAKPAKGDKGFKLMKHAFDNQEEYFNPSIRKTR